MAIILRLDRMMADRKISLNELSEKVGIANVNLSKIKTGKKIDLLKGDVTKLNRVLSHPLRVPLQGGCYSVVK